MAAFKFREIQELLRQLMLSPPGVRLRYADRLEELLLDFDPGRTYPYEFIYFRVTGFRPKEDRREAYPGRDILPDLLRLLEKTSASASADVGGVKEKVYTLSELQNACGVSVRTIHRWRRKGLVSRKYAFADGRKRTGIRQVALERFLAQHKDSTDWARRFSKVTDAEEQKIARLARRCARAEGLSLTATANRIAQQFGRAPETIRLLLKRFDRDHPHEPIFDQPAQLVSAAARRRIYADYRRGTPVDVLQQRYGRSRSSIYRIINQQRATEVLQEAPSYFHEEGFADQDADEQILGSELRAILEAAQVPGPRRETLSSNEETALFRAYNYVKFRIAQARQQLNPKRYVSARLIRRVRTLKEQALQIKDCLLRAHLALVERVARQHAGEALGFRELSAEGGACLRELVESFDYRRRGRFPRYATLELQKRFARMIAAPGSPATEPEPGHP